MRQFEVFANPSAASASFAPYLVVLQSHYVDLKSVVVAPLVTDKLATSIEIAVDLRDQTYVLALTELGSVRSASLRSSLGDLLAYEYEVHRSLDRLFKGF